MLGTKLISFLSIGTAAMLCPILIQSVWQKMKLWKSVVLALSLTVIGTLGTFILFYIENHQIGGTSFYGAVFLVPVVFLLMAMVLREPYGSIMDLCAPAECAMLCIMKLRCCLDGCCGGRILFEDFRFPSQPAELLNALVIMVVLLVLAKKKPGRGDLYPWYMIIYGCSRFALNLLRETKGTFLLGLPAGNFWSVVAVAWGIAWLVRIKKQQAQA